MAIKQRYGFWGLEVFEDWARRWCQIPCGVCVWCFVQKRSPRKLWLLASPLDNQCNCTAVFKTLFFKSVGNIKDLRQQRRQRQQEHHQTKGLMNRAVAADFRHKSLYFSLLSLQTITRNDHVLRVLGILVADAYFPFVNKRCHFNGRCHNW